MRLSKAIDALAIATRAEGRSPRTVQAYREKLGHLVAFLGDPPIEAVTVDDLRRFLAAQRDRGLSPFTIKSRVRALKRLWNFAEAEGIVTENPARRIKTPRPATKEPKGISNDDVLAILATCGDDLAGTRDRAAIMLLLDSGCRAGGLCGLRVDDLNLDEGLASVTEKGKKHRYVMFTPTTAEALRRWLEVKPKGEYVFVGLKGKGPLSPSGLWQMLKRRGKEAGVSGPVGPHSFRHGFARSYLIHGGDLVTLADILGHSDVRTTAAYYARFNVRELQRKHREHSPVSRLFGSEDD